MGDIIIISRGIGYGLEENVIFKNDSDDVSPITRLEVGMFMAREVAYSVMRCKSIVKAHVVVPAFIFKISF